jgi:hypothetical protein
MSSYVYGCGPCCEWAIHARQILCPIEKKGRGLTGLRPYATVPGYKTSLNGRQGSGIPFLWLLDL